MTEDSLHNLSMNETPLNAILTDIVTNFMFVNIGIIKAVHNEYFVDVSLYYNDNISQEIVIPDVRLLQLGTTKCKVFIQPSIGDNVLLLTPKDFIPKLVFNKKPSDIDFGQFLYSTENMCAILIKDESDENVKTTVTITHNGDITVDTKGEAFVDAKKIHLNGDKQNNNESHFVRYEELEAAVNKFMTPLNTHTHTGVETGSGSTLAPATMEFDISKAKIPTVLTEKASS